MKRKMVALALICGAVMTVIPVALAWDDTDMDIQTGTWGIAIAVVRANYNGQGKITAWDCDYDGGWKPGGSPPSGWSATNVGNCGTVGSYPYDSVWADSHTYILDQYDRIKEVVSASAELP